MNQNLFGTDGIRAKVGDFPLDLNSLILLGQAIGLWAQKKYNNHFSVAIGNDTRKSCSFVKATLKTGLLLNQTNLVDLHTIPTPGVFLFIQQQIIDLGIVVSASHNPYQYNGIKLFDQKTGKISKEDEKTITNFFYKLLSKKTTQKYEIFGTESQTEAQPHIPYFKILFDQFEKSFLSGKKIILDCSYGATYSLAPLIFETFNADVSCLNNKPDGKNINQNCGSTHPEKLQEEVVKQKADIGFAFDGDGDRVVIVNRHGELKDGDDILALLSTHPHYKKENAAVGTIMSNCGLEAFLENQNKKLIRTQVGDKHVAKALKENNLSLGAEPSGHIICADYLNTGDGIFAALRVAETAALTNNWDLKTFEKYPQINISLPVTEKKDLTTGALVKLISQAESKLTFGRTVVRYSGTEPILRVMVEEKTKQLAETVCAKLVKDLQKELG